MDAILPSGDEFASPAFSFVEALEAEGITHVVTVPDNTSASVLTELARRQKAFSAYASEGSEPPPVEPIRTLFATREGEAMGLAAGLWMGGATPILLIQNTGLMEAGDGLRGVVARMGLPMVLLVTCRGYPKARKAGVEPRGSAESASDPIDRGILVRSDLDSVAHMTEGTLRAWGIPFSYLDDPADLAPLGAAMAQARQEGRPVALLIDTTFESVA